MDNVYRYMCIADCRILGTQKEKTGRCRCPALNSHAARSMLLWTSIVVHRQILRRANMLEEGVMDNGHCILSLVLSRRYSQVSIILLFTWQP